jgi:hypothetical protein
LSENGEFVTDLRGSEYVGPPSKSVDYAWGTLLNGESFWHIERIVIYTELRTRSQCGSRRPRIRHTRWIIPVARLRCLLHRSRCVSFSPLPCQLQTQSTFSIITDNFRTGFARRYIQSTIPYSISRETLLGRTI